MIRTLTISVLITVALLSISCGSKGTPEARIRTAIDELIHAAEHHDIAPFKKYLSEHLQDQDGLNKAEIIQRLKFLFLRHPDIHLSILSLDVIGTSDLVRQADLELLMSSTQIPQDKGYYEFVFRYEDDIWKITSLDWGQGYGR